MQAGSVVSGRFNMLTRIITGAGYVAVMLGFFLMREFIDVRIFHLLTYFLIAWATFEVARMVKEKALRGVYPLGVAFGIIFPLAYFLGEWLVCSGWGWLIAVTLVALIIMALCVYAFFWGKSGAQFVYSVIPFVYPAIPLMFMLMSNSVENGFIILLLSFVVSPFADTFAYFTGRLIGGPKLCPKISPKKTWSGAIGGVIGGIVGAIIVYFIFKPTINFFSPVFFFALVGLVASIINTFGDLIESFLKRKVGVKDSGKLLPGHGGVLDRIDGTQFVVLFLYLIFLLV